MSPHLRPAHHIMTTYRRFIMEGKASHNLNRISQGRPRSRRCMRAQIHYRAYIDAYLKAKRAVIAGLFWVDA